MGEMLDYFKKKKNLVNLLILVMLILALPLGLNILRQQQVIKSRAAVDPITFAGANVRQKNDGTWVATNSQIQIQLISPLAPLTEYCRLPHPLQLQRQHLRQGPHLYGRLVRRQHQPPQVVPISIFLG